MERRSATEPSPSGSQYAVHPRDHDLGVGRVDGATTPALSCPAALGGRVQFEAVSSTAYGGTHDLIRFFDCLHG